MVTIRVRSMVWFVTGAMLATAVTLMFVNAWRADAAPGDTDALAGLIVTLSTIAMRYGDVIEALDLNPVFVGNRGEGLMAADALLVPRRPSA